MSTPTEPAARLEAAAAHLRQLAEAATATTGTDTWTTRPRYPDDLTSNSVSLLAGRRSLLHGGGDRARGHGPFVIDAVGTFIAAMSPPVGKALAQLLETEARVDTEDRAALAAEGRDPEVEHRSCTVATCTTEAALALADAILGAGQ